MKMKLVLLALLFVLAPLSYAPAEILIIPIDLQRAITQAEVLDYQAAMPQGWPNGWDPVQEPMPSWLAAIIDDPLGWMKEYDPDDPLADPDHPISVTLTNNSLVAWTDFHFDILPHPTFGGDMSNFSIEQVSPLPGSDRPLDSIQINNAVTSTMGPQIHYWHWSSGKQILPGESVNYNFLLHNPANQPFKLNFFPTMIIPEPATLLLMACGFAVPLWRRRTR